ncbi:MAG: DNA topoisomerase IV subunit A [Candidatus Izimaplasma sp.]|nr:DNA topoisomerase IV subunit A [Candidatus Izimaplasma bacterium]
MKRKVIEEINTFVDEKIIKENLEDIVGERFGRYSKYIIQDRALPDVRDGLKPVQRRILFSMYKLGMFSDKPYKKCARIVGDVIGKYHPHGDTSVYDAMVRLSQPWKIRNLLIDMHGNNGSIDGDSAAAMRYTEARMSLSSEILLRDIDKRTVVFIPNFDDEEYEPIVLPARYPNLLVNGSTGISAGYATDIPPHNLREIIKAVIKRIDTPDMTIDDILKIVKGPDFPTGAIVQGKDQIRQAFETGRGRVIMKSKSVIENQQIIITEIPYEVNKATLVRKMDDIRIKKGIDGIAEVRDESDREGLRIVIDIKKNFNPQFILNFLHKKTDLSKSYNYNMVSINNKRPMLMGILPMIDAYILHQKEVITNRSNYELRRAQKRSHIVEGIIKMMDILDEVIALIRASKNKRDAKNRLMKKYKFTEEQSEAIVTLQLYRLSSTDIKALEKEHNKLELQIEKLSLILHTEEELQNVIKTELKSISRTLSTPRKSEIEEEIERITITEEELVVAEQAVIGISREGYVKRSSVKSFKATDKPNIKENDSMLFVSEVSTVDTILLFTNKGNYVYLPVYKVSNSKWKDLGTHINNIVQLEENEKITKIVHVDNFKANKHLVFITRNNLIKLTKLEDFNVSRYSKTIKAISLNKGDSLVKVDVTDSLDNDLLIVTRKGLALKFSLSEISVTSTTAKGVKGLNLSPRQKLATGLVLKEHNDLLILTHRGTIKRLSLEDIPKKRRTNKGVKLYKEVKSNPYLVIDLCLMNATQYKNRAKISINTDKMLVVLRAFDIKTDKTVTGKAYIKPKQGKPIFMNIEELEIDSTIPNLNDYVIERNINLVQQQLFE